MTVSELVTELLQLPQDLDVHVLVDESSDLANLASVQFVGSQPFDDGDQFLWSLS